MMHTISGWCVSTNKHSSSNLRIRLWALKYIIESVPVFTWWQWSKLELEWESGGLRGLSLGGYVEFRSEQAPWHAESLQLMMGQKKNSHCPLGWLIGALLYEWYLLHQSSHDSSKTLAGSNVLASMMLSFQYSPIPVQGSEEVSPCPIWETTTEVQCCLFSWTSCVPQHSQPQLSTAVM